MHELGIAQKLIDAAVALLPDPTFTVTRLRLQLGTLAGLSEEELRFGFAAMAQATPCAHAELQIENVPAVVHCPQCGRDFAVTATDALVCPACGSPAVVVVQGKELIIASLEVTDGAAEAANVTEEPAHNPVREPIGEAASD